MQTKTINHNGSVLHVPESYQLQREREPDQWEELGTLGLEAYSGYITAAYNTKLEWPGVEPLYSRIWRSDPEVAVVRSWLAAMSGKLNLQWELPEEKDGRALEPPTDDDKRALELAQSLGSDVPGGLAKWIESACTRTIFYGWGWWELPVGLRRAGWSAPDESGWESEYDDGLVGLRDVAWRDYSSFFRWDLDDRTGRVFGMEQLDPPNDHVIIPRERSLHITYGDHDNPEGLAMMESLWRLERIKYGLEVTYGIGAEHTAGHVVFTVRQKLDAEAKAELRKAARALLSAVEGNYATDLIDPQGTPVFKADVVDVPFSAAESLLNAIKYWGMLKLQLFGMQWVAMATTADTGAYSAVQDASGMSLLMFNALAETNIKQASEQIGRRIFDHPVNRAALPDMTRRPRLAFSEVTKPIELGGLGQFTQMLGQLVQLGRDDEIAIRRESGFLPETPGDEQENPMEEEGDDEPTVPDGPAVDGRPRRMAPENIDAETGLNGAQITAVLTVLDNLAGGSIAASVAVELLIAVGIEPQRAQRMISAQVARSGGRVRTEDDMPDEDAPVDSDDRPEDEQPDGPADLAQRPLAVSEDEEPIDVTPEALNPEERADAAVRRFRRWAEENAPDLARLLDARVVDEEDE